KTWCRMPVATLVRVTVAPGTAVVEGSVISPVICPVCAIRLREAQMAGRIALQALWILMSRYFISKGQLVLVGATSAATRRIPMALRRRVANRGLRKAT